MPGIAKMPESAHRGRNAQAPRSRHRHLHARKTPSTVFSRGAIPLSAADDNRWLVFVSSAMPRPRSRRIGTDRRAAKDAALTQSEWFRVWTWEDCAFPGTFGPESLYLTKAAESHILILLIHDRLTPNTKKEYDISVKNRRGQMIFFRDGFRLDQPARHFRNKLRDATYWRYKNCSELKSIIIRGLRENLLRYATIGQKASIGTTINYGRLGV
jgi:hypothetical protein